MLKRNSQEYTIHGLYDFRNNQTLLDTVTKDISGDTITHEHTHNLISSFSSIGLLLIMMRKVALVDQSKQWLYNAIMGIIKKVQEITATNVEYYNIWLKEGKEAFDIKLKLLYQNREYRRYFDELQDVHKALHTEEDVSAFINTILGLAIISMNIDVSIFEQLAHDGEAEFRRFFNDSKNRELYHPLTRFKVLINFHLRNIQNENILQKVTALNANTIYGDTTIQCRQVIKNIYAGSKAIQRIEERIESVSMTPDRILYYENTEIQKLAVYPVNLNETKWNREYDITDPDTFLRLLKEDANKYLVFTHLVSGFEDIPMLQCIDSSPSTVFCPYALESIPWLLSNIENRIVFIRYKLYARIRKLPMLLRNRQCYILMDTSMAGNIQFIHEEFRGAKYTYFSEDNYIVVLVYNDSCTLIQAIATDAKQELPHVLDEYGIHYMEYGVSGLYGDPAPKELARASYEMASDESIVQNLFESGDVATAVKHLISGKNGGVSLDMRNKILQEIKQENTFSQ